jgi:antitoxin component YwqK of YwqJK toxin-antitoxin module
MLLLTAGMITSCGQTDDETTTENGQEKTEPLIVETNEGELVPDLTISNTIPTEGMEDGNFEKFYPNGNLEVEGLVVNGKRSGLWTSYHPAGNKQSENFYVNGDLDGKTVVYFPNGQIMYIGYYTNGVNDGQWLYFDDEGTLKKEVIYSNGEIVSTTDKNEKPVE